jgi:hypothetical protein
MRVEQVTDSEAAWFELEPFIARAVAESKGLNTVADVRGALADGRYCAYMVLEALEDGGAEQISAVLVCEIVQHPGAKVLFFVTFAGDGFERWAGDLSTIMSRVARHFGCSRMALTGRRGWVKKLAPFGWQEQFVMCEVSL